MKARWPTNNVTTHCNILVLAVIILIFLNFYVKMIASLLEQDIKTIVWGGGGGGLW